MHRDKRCFTHWSSTCARLRAGEKVWRIAKPSVSVGVATSQCDLKASQENGQVRNCLGGYQGGSKEPSTMASDVVDLVRESGDPKASAITKVLGLPLDLLEKYFGRRPAIEIFRLGDVIPNSKRLENVATVLFGVRA